MAKVAQYLGAGIKNVTQGQALCLPECVSFSLFEDLGTLNSDGSFSESSGLNTVEYEEIEYSPIRFETVNNGSCVFNSLCLEIYKKQYQYDFNEILTCSVPEGIDQSLTLYVQNRAPDVNPVVTNNLGTMMITIPRERYISFKLSMFEKASVLNLPSGITFENGLLSGITYQGGVWRGELESTDGSRIPYTIIVPQLERIF